MSELLRVMCHECDTSFVSAHQGMCDELASHPGLTLEECCPHCGTCEVYAAADYRKGALVGPCRPITNVTVSG